MCLGILCGWLSSVIPGKAGDRLLEIVLEPLSEVILQTVFMASEFVIFLTVINSICNLGDMAVFQRIGKKVIAHYYRLLGFISIAACLLMAPFFTIQDYQLDVQKEFYMIYKMIIEIFPKDPFTPFIEGSLLQIIFMAFCCGLVLLAMGIKVEAVRDLMSQLELAIHRFTENIVVFMPFVVFVALFHFTATGRLKTLVSIWKYPLLVVVIDAVMLGLGFLGLRLRWKLPVRFFGKKMASVLKESFMTASPDVVFDENLEVCEYSFGINRMLAEAGVSLGQILFMPAAIVELCCMTLFLSEYCGKSLDLGGVIMLIFVGFTTGVAMPPFPGAAVSCHMLMLRQFGIPISLIAVVHALDPILARMTTMTDIGLLQMELIHVGDKLSMIDEKRLRKHRSEKKKENK